MTCAQRGALPSPIVGWIYNYATSNYWRVSGFYELDDLCQDGLLIAVICRERYGVPGVDITHPHFMSLVQTTFKRHLIDLVRKLEVRGDTLYLADQKVSEVALPALGELARYMEEWPEYLKRAVRHLIDRLPIQRHLEIELRQILCDC
jgi:DNA-directed RNA polymerase specialized sigma24 family protein